jgi:hypothetical protein
MPHPPYSPYLAPADFFLFPKRNITLKGRRFQTIEEIQENAIREMRAITESIPTIEETLRTVYRQYRGLLCRGQCLKYCKISNKVFIAKFRFFLNKNFIFRYLIGRAA